MRISTFRTEPLLLRLLFIVLIVYIVIFTIKAYLAGARSAKRGRTANSEGEEMVLDPQCQTYVPKKDAILQAGNYFCSRECAKLFLSR